VSEGKLAEDSFGADWLWLAGAVAFLQLAAICAAR